MTIEEARSHIGQSVLHSGVGAEAEDAVIAQVLTSHVYVRRRRDDRFMSARPEDLTLPAEQVAEAHDLAGSQARLNEIIAEIVIEAAEATVDPRLIDRVLDALQDLNLAGGYPFFHESSRWHSEEQRELAEHLAVLQVRRVETYLEGQVIRARAQAYTHEFMAAQKEITLRHRGGGAEPALIYLVTHDSYGAAKVGVGDMRGLRLAQHRREGWQVCATFQVTAKAALAIETDILRWWRRDLGRPSCLGRHQMPQGGHTETVALSGIDLAATVTRICNLAVSSPAADLAGPRVRTLPPA